MLVEPIVTVLTNLQLDGPGWTDCRPLLEDDLWRLFWAVWMACFTSGRENAWPSGMTMHRAVPPSNKTIAICDTQPIYAEGLRSLLAGSVEFNAVKTLDSLQAAAEFVKAEVPDLLILDRGFGIRPVLNFMRELQLDEAPTAVIVWGLSITVEEATGLVRAGARGIARKSTDIPTLLAGLRVVANGQVWMESSILPDISAKPWPGSSNLSPRENQVLELLGQGFKNPEIALQLGIRRGTVKIFISHLFEKAGVRSRAELALHWITERAS